MAGAAVQRQTGDSRRRDDTGRHGETEELGLTVEVTQRRPALRADRSGLGIDVYPAHQREVEDEAAVVHSIAGGVVAAALDREQQVLLTREVDPVDDVGGSRALQDQRRPAVDQPVPDRAGVVVPFVARAHDRAAGSLDESLNGLGVEPHVGSHPVCHRSSSLDDTIPARAGY